MSEKIGHKNVFCVWFIQSHKMKNWSNILLTKPHVPQLLASSICQRNSNESSSIMHDKIAKYFVVWDRLI